MTTTTKKSLLTIFVLVFALVCCFTAVSAVAEDALVADFNEFVADNLAGIDVATMFDNEVDVENVRTAVNKYTALNETQKQAISQSSKTVFGALNAASTEAFAIDAYVTNVLYDKLHNVEGARVYISDEATINTYKDRINALSANAKAWVERLEAYDNIAAIEAKIAELKVAMQNAIDAIDAIKYYDAGVMGANGYIVLASETSITAAKTALDAIYGSDFLAEEFESEWQYVTNLGDYTAAVEALAAEKAKAALVDEAILAAYAQVQKDVKYWTVKDVIDAANDKYEALALDAKYDATYNDLQGIVAEKAKLDEMLAELADIEAEIADVEDAITAIGTVEYTTTCEQLIKNARDAFDALDADIVAADNNAVLENGATIVANYADLIAAEKALADLNAKFEAIKAAIVNMAEVYKVEGDILAAYVKAQSLYMEAERTNPEMIARLAENVYDGTYEHENYDVGTAVIDDYQAAYAFYAARAQAVLTKVEGVINLIKILEATDVEMTVDFKNLLDQVKAAYDGLEDEDKRFVTNYHVLPEKEAAFNNLLAVADDWVDAVNAISLPVSATQASFDQVAAAKAAFNAMGADAQAVMASLSGSADGSIWKEYEDAYAIYADAVADSDALYNAIVALANKMTAINTNNIDLADVAAWDADLAVITGEYNALGEDSKAYLQNYEDGAPYANYLKALNNSKKYKVEEAIALIPTIVVDTVTVPNVTVADREVVADAREIANAYIAEVEGATDAANGGVAYIRNYDILLAAEEMIDDEIAELEAWEEAVKALVGGDYANIDKIVAAKDAMGIDLDAANDLVAEYATLTDAQKAYTAEDGEDDYTKLLTIIEKAIEQAEDVEDAMEAINAKSELTADDIDDIEAIQAAYADLSDSQKALVDATVVDAFEDQAEKLVFATSFEAIINNLYDAVVAGKKDITTDTPVIIGLVKTLYNEFTAEQKALITNYGKVAEIEEAYELAVEMGKVVNATELKATVASLSELVNSLNSANSTMNSAIQAAQAEIDLLEAEINAAQDALDKANEDLDAANKTVETLQGTVTTITIIFSILVAGLAAAVVVLFIKRRA